MSFFGNYVSAAVRQIHDGAIKTIASWDPETAGEAQILQWNQTAAELANVAAKAATDLNTQRKIVSELESNIARYTAAAEKLAATNESAANQAADKAIELSEQLESAKATLADAESWATETRTSAEDAEAKVAAGRAAIEKAKREQARALQEKHVAEARLAERERVAGITKGLNGADTAIDALTANAAKSKQEAEAARLRSNVLGKTTEADVAIKAALDEVDGGPKPQSLAEKLAKLKK